MSQLALESGDLLVARISVPGKRPGPVVAELAAPSVDEAGADAEVAGGFGGVAEVIGETDRLSLVLGRE